MRARLARRKESSAVLALVVASSVAAFGPWLAGHWVVSGLGLAALLGIVRAHGGGVPVTSRPGAGTTFQVLLPLRETAQ